MAAITAGANTTVAPLPDGRWRIEKTGGMEGEYDAAAASIAAITGDFALRVEDLSAPNSILFGVSANPHGNDGFAAIGFGAWLYGGGAYVLENGAPLAPMHPHNGVTWIVRTGTELRCHLGLYPDAAVPVRVMTGMSGPLWFDCTIGPMGGSMSVRFDPPGAWSRGALRAPARLGIGIGA